MNNAATQTRRLTRAERFAALRDAGAGYAAPAFKIGDAVTLEARASKVTDYTRTASGAFVYTVANYAGVFMVGEDHPDLEAVEA